MHDPDPDLPLIRRVIAHRFTKTQLVSIDVVVVVVVTASMEFLMSRRAPKVDGAGWVAAAWAAYTVAAAATLFRRRVPRLALTIVVVVVVVALSLRAGGPVVFFAAMSLYSLVAVSSRPRGMIVAGVVAGAVLAATIAGGGDQVVMAATGGVALVLLGWLAGENMRDGRVYASLQAERAAEREAAAAAAQAEQVSRVLAEERAQIARDLHDIVAHAMSIIAVRSGVARMVIDSDPQQARDALSIIELTTRRSLHEMRLLVGVLRNPEDHRPAMSPVPDLADLDRLLADAAAAGVAADVDMIGEVRPLDPAAGVSAYRIVQEALTNVVRHAGPTHARVVISYLPGEVIIEVTDEGPHGQEARPTARAGGGHGLIGMRERTALFGGELAAGPYGTGFRVTASLPTTEFRSDIPARDGSA